MSEESHDLSLRETQILILDSLWKMRQAMEINLGAIEIGICDCVQKRRLSESHYFNFCRKRAELWGMLQYYEAMAECGGGVCAYVGDRLIQFCKDYEVYMESMQHLFNSATPKRARYQFWS